MSLITELDVVNLCLAAMGELPINSLENSRNPIVTNARAVFRNAVVEEQSPGWWFNNEILRLLPSNDGTYAVPTDCLSLSTTDDFNPSWLTIRSRRLYDTGNARYHIGDNELQVKITRLIPFDDLPYSAQRLVRDAAVSLFQVNYDGDELKIQQAQQAYNAAYATCMADHIRSVKANMLHKGSYGAAVVRSRIPYGRTGRWR